MKEFFKKLDTETKWGGIFGLIAIIAILAEMVIGGISPETIVAAVKDTAGTVVSVMVFYIAVKHILKQIKENTKNYSEIEDVPEIYKNALVAVEDKRFYIHNNIYTIYNIQL